jgi:hypothetical protein
MQARTGFTVDVSIRVPKVDCSHQIHLGCRVVYSFLCFLPLKMGHVLSVVLIRRKHK